MYGAHVATAVVASVSARNIVRVALSSARLEAMCR
jgi:hypothetical protein